MYSEAPARRSPDRFPADLENGLISSGQRFRETRRNHPRISRPVIQAADHRTVTLHNSPLHNRLSFRPQRSGVESLPCAKSKGTRSCYSLLVSKSLNFRVPDRRKVVRNLSLPSVQTVIPSDQRESRDPQLLLVSCPTQNFSMSELPTTHSEPGFQ